MKIAFLDFETTGLTDHDEPIELCVEVWNMGQRGPSYASRYMPRGPVHPGAAAVNGYNPQTWGNCGPGGTPTPYFSAEHAHAIAAILASADEGRGVVLGGAATAFDRGFLVRAFESVRVDLPKLSHRLFDVQSMAVPLVVMGKIETPSLENIAAFFGLGPVKHDSVSDVHLTINVFERLLSLFCPVLQ